VSLTPNDPPKPAAGSADRAAPDPARPLPGSPAPKRPRDPQDRRLAALASRARAALWWERVWPTLAALLSLAALFVALAWFGVFLETPRGARIAALGLFALAGLAVLARAATTIRPPGAQETIARLDRDVGQAHRPVATLADALAGERSDPLSEALWRAHRARALEATQGLRVRAPSPRLVDRDRYALRAGALLLLIAAGFVAGDQKNVRLRAAFDWRDAAALALASRVDVYLDPPAYTGRPPIVLPTKPGDPQAGVFADAARPVEAPIGARIVVRGSAGDLEVTAQGDVAPPPDDPAAPAQARASRRAEAARDGETILTLAGDGRLSIKAGAARYVFDLKAIPDKAPTIAWIEAPSTDQKSLTLRYRAQDDYGIESAEARLSRPLVAGKPVEGRSLYEPPRIPLVVPPGGTGDGETLAELADHPWAGARATLILVARDGAGQEGASAPLDVALPARVFSQPLARALVEQRRDLALSPLVGRARAQEALAALKLAPDFFGVDASVYLGLSFAQTRLREARTDDDLREVVDFLWEMAVRVEDGDLPQAQRELKQAQQALREAMERGASSEELKKLMDDLRQALEKYLREYAQKTPPRDGDQGQTINKRDLDKMLERMEDTAKRGDMADARRMLDQLERTIDNLQRADRETATDQARREMNRQLGEMDRLLREQRRLRDDTYRKERQERRDGDARLPRDPLDDESEDQLEDEPPDAAPEAREEPSTSDKQLAERQRQLRDKLDELRERMKRQGLEKEPGFEDAERDMRQAERDLGRDPNRPSKQGEGTNEEAARSKPGKGPAEGGRRAEGAQPRAGRNGGQDADKRPDDAAPDRRGAVDAQGRAIEALRKGMDGLQRQLGQDGEGEQAGGAGSGQSSAAGTRPSGSPSQSGDRQGRDPLDRERGPNGRPLRDGSLNEGQASDRARRVQEELRRRLGQPERPREELDYYERLLKR
jgi:uncharacterized protein (TIGR02302 family)